MKSLGQYCVVLFIMLYKFCGQNPRLQCDHRPPKLTLRKYRHEISGIVSQDSIYKDFYENLTIIF